MATAPKDTSIAIPKELKDKIVKLALKQKRPIRGLIEYLVDKEIKK